MKKISVFLFSILLFICSFSLVNGSFWSDLFKNKGEIPYCSGNDCTGFEETANTIANEIDVFETGKFSEYIQNVIAYLLGFLAIIAVIIIIYAGFNILTAAGDEEKVKSSKKIILYVVIGMAIIFLAGPITRFVIGIFTS